MNILAHLLAIVAIVSRVKCELSTFGYCIKNKPYLGVIPCLGEQALHTLQSIEEADNYTITNGLSMVRDEGYSMPRSIPFNFLDRDTLNLRTLLDQTGVILSQRSLQWDMSTLYPGLMMRVGPAGDSNSVLEFVMDNPHGQELDDRAGEPTTARLLTKSLILPFLLGLKFNLAVLLPIILGVLILIGKKAVFLSKLALLLTGVFGAGGVASLFGLASKPISGIGLGLGGLGLGSYGGLGYQVHDHHYKDYQDYKDYKKSTHRHFETTQKPFESDRFYDYETKFFNKRGGPQVYERESTDFKTDSSTEPTSAASEFVSRNDYKNFAWHTIKQ
ncbi:uncharacterized protein LOC132257866 [Phlebotomus argentipes]|uniref:uncharacterized protein LOC132257866 n=1 Tax=Phlebotomus argentipes TaxID=94469 RepID=UPI0028937286|nr:uncharacterized protein LOC132257866 [Phlebotomus argentipes]